MACQFPKESIGSLTSTNSYQCKWQLSIHIGYILTEPVVGGQSRSVDSQTLLRFSYLLRITPISVVEKNKSGALGKLASSTLALLIQLTQISSEGVIGAAPHRISGLT